MGEELKQNRQFIKKLVKLSDEYIKFLLLVFLLLFMLQIFHSNLFNYIAIG